MTSETTINFVVNGYWMIGFTVAFFCGLLAIVWKGKQEIHDAIGTELEKHTKCLDVIKHNVDVIGKFLISQNNEDFDRTELQTMSPFQLTEDGKKFISDIGFDKVFFDRKDDFFSFIDLDKPKLKYDVESASIKSIYILSDNDYMDFLKIYFYNNPNRNIENTAPTLGVFVRDEYLKEHQDIKE